MLVVAAGCGCHRHLPVETERRDSVSVIYKDSTVYHIDTLYVSLPDQRASVVQRLSEPSHLENDVASSDAYVDSTGLLHHSLMTKEKPIPLAVPIPEHTITSSTASTKSEVITVTKYVEKSLTKWQTFWIRAGKILITISLLSGAVLLLRRTL